MARILIRRYKKQAQYYIENKDGLSLKMRQIPGGKFTMGSPEDELERRDNEGPQNQVTITNFFLGQYPITQQQWRIVAGWEEANRKLEPNPSHFKGDNRPVEQVSWHDAQEFCDRLSQRTGREYRLPTEAEWEYACRAGTTTPFHFGETITTDLANYNGDYAYGRGVKGKWRKETTPVDYFQVANAFGLSDMHGNVYEWCEDDWHANYQGVPVDGGSWISGDNGTIKVVRSGSWISNPENCRCAYRYRFNSAYRYNNIGFRISRSAARILT